MTFGAFIEQVFTDAIKAHPDSARIDFSVAETGDADWRRVFAVNADGVFHVGRALARVMSVTRKVMWLVITRSIMLMFSIIQLS